jgi:hypothetical protein
MSIHPQTPSNPTTEPTGWSKAAPTFYGLEDKATQEWHATLVGFYRDSKRLDWLLSQDGLDWIVAELWHKDPTRADIDQAMARPPK